MKTNPTKSLPDFELADPVGIDPTAIDVNKPLGAFVLVLASGYNDMKGIAYANSLAISARPTARAHLAWVGQLAGMQNQVNRLLAGLLHELLNVIEEHRGVIETNEFEALLAGLSNERARRSWKELYAAAIKSPVPGGKRSDDWLMLVKLRNKVAFHYDAKVLGMGYKRHFFKVAKQYADRAIFSDGNSMEGTRFYFADAAAEEAMPELTGLDHQGLAKKLGNLVQTVNFALKYIVIAYLNSVAKATPYAGAAARPR